MSDRRPAKIPGRCAKCGTLFDEGALIEWHAGSGDFPSLTFGPCWPECKGTVRSYGGRNLKPRLGPDDLVDMVCSDSNCGEHIMVPRDARSPVCACGGELVPWDEVERAAEAAADSPAWVREAIARHADFTGIIGSHESYEGSAETSRQRRQATSATCSRSLSASGPPPVAGDPAPRAGSGAGRLLGQRGVGG